MSTPLARQTERDALTIKRVISDKLNRQIRRRVIGKAALAEKLGTSRSAVDRLLDPKNVSITLQTLVKAANNLGYKINLTLEPKINKIKRVPTPRAHDSLVQQLGSALDKLSLR